ncbi:hypothetical protein [Amaricoccus sp. W119]|uniref:hypothetical protein n=1 Tax=Amaricoccus sp. W119 TaxID=3391833 RepID=UPI0039A77D03
MVDYALGAERDFELIFDHLFDSYVARGEAAAEALERARRSTVWTEFRSSARPGPTFVLARGSCDAAELRSVPIADLAPIRVLAVFFGARDHVRHMLIRMIAGGGGRLITDRRRAGT